MGQGSRQGSRVSRFLGFEGFRHWGLHETPRDRADVAYHRPGGLPTTLLHITTAHFEGEWTLDLILVAPEIEIASVIDYGLQRALIYGSLQISKQTKASPVHKAMVERLCRGDLEG